MPEKFQSLFRTSFGSVLVILFLGLFSTAGAQKSVSTGKWNGAVKAGKDDKITIVFERHTATDGEKREDHIFSFNKLQNLSREQAESSDATVKFTLTREAGVIEFTGKFAYGKGAGDFRLTPSSQFIGAMKAREFDFEPKSDSLHAKEVSDNLLFSATVLNLTSSFADDLKTMNLGSLTVFDLLSARLVNLTPQFQKEMADAGFTSLGFKELTAARMFNLNADYIRQIRALGFKAQDFQKLVNMRTFNVTPEYVVELREAGFSDIGPDTLVTARIYHLNADYIKRMRALGFGSESFKDFLNMRSFNVTPEYVAELRHEGLTDLNPDALVKLKIWNIDGDFVRFTKAGKDELSVENLIRKRMVLMNR